MKRWGILLKAAFVVLIVAVVIWWMSKVKADQDFAFSPVKKTVKWGTADPALQAALDSNDAVLVGQLLRKIPKTSIKPNFLTLLARDDHKTSLEAAIAAGWNPNGEKNDGGPLIAAVTFGQVQALRVLLEHHARWDVYDAIGMPPMSLAAKQVGHSAALVNTLFEFGVPTISYRFVDPVHQFGYKPPPGAPIPLPRKVRTSPLAAAISAHNLDTAEILLRHGDDPSLALRSPPKTLEDLKFLLDHKANPDQPLANGSSLVGWYATRGVWQGSPKEVFVPWRDSEEAMKLLLARGAHVDGIAKGWTESSADPRKPLVDGTPLYFCAAYGQADGVRLLLAHGANPLKKAGNGQTALDVATGECKNILARITKPK